MQRRNFLASLLAACGVAAVAKAEEQAPMAEAQLDALSANWEPVEVQAWTGTRTQEIPEDIYCLPKERPDGVYLEDAYDIVWIQGKIKEIIYNYGFPDGFVTDVAVLCGDVLVRLTINECPLVLTLSQGVCWKLTRGCHYLEAESGCEYAVRSAQIGEPNVRYGRF